MKQVIVLISTVLLGILIAGYVTNFGPHVKSQTDKLNTKLDALDYGATHTTSTGAITLDNTGAIDNAAGAIIFTESGVKVIA
jgi:hypothetical protein